MIDLGDQSQQSSLFNQNSIWFKVILFLAFLLAALIRRDEIQAPGHLIEREYNSAIFARAFYFQENDEIESWRRDNARITKDRLPTLEPPITEYLISLLYKVVGAEKLWYARYLTSAFWLIGGIFFYKITKNLLSAETALISTVYYLFAPWAIIISRSFQPDSLMMMMFMVSLYSLIIYFEQPNLKRLWISAILTGTTLLLRPLVIFVLFGAFVALAIYLRKSWKRLLDSHLVIFFIVSLAFPLAFYGYGIYIANFLRDQAALSFRPYLLTRLQFWQGWFELGIQVVGYSAFIGALLGFFLLRKSAVKILIIGMLIGYIIFGMVFTFHVHTHPYYHIQLFPIIGICSAPLVIFLGKTLKGVLGNKWIVPAVAIVFFGLYFSYFEVRNSLYQAVFEDPNIASEIGDVVNHSSNNVFVAYHYGLPLEYYGEFTGAPWPVSIDDPFYRRPYEEERSVQERIASLGFQPEYFVITNFDLFRRKHQDLKLYLENSCSVFKKTDQYLIYNDCLSSTAVLQ